MVRQLRYSLHHENSIDVVLFVNGFPVATAELKSHYTQGVQDAVYQYKTDREPVFKAKNMAEPLLAFPGGALVHFAVSNSAAEMSTRLAGLDTVFLPFNQGNAGGAGNPPKADHQLLPRPDRRGEEGAAGRRRDPDRAHPGGSGGGQDHLGGQA